MGRVERMWARYFVPEGRVLVPQAPGMGFLPWATGTDTRGHLTWGPGDCMDQGTMCCFL